MRLRCVLLGLLLLMAACGPAPANTPPPTETTAPTPTTSIGDTLIVRPDETHIGFTTEALGGRMHVVGSYQVLSGTVLVEEVDGLRRITARLNIDTPSVTVGMGLVDEALRLGMETGTYPVAIFDATSTTLVPITEAPIHFVLAGTLDLHGQQRAVTMTVDPATLAGGRLDARATMTINLSDYGIALPEAIVSSVIVLDVSLLAVDPGLLAHRL